ncbi:MAG TPA: hypothetical protein VF374_05175 [Thermoplasmata archaeon]
MSVFVLTAFSPTIASAWTAGNPSFEQSVYCIGNTGGQLIYMRATYIPSEWRSGDTYDVFKLVDSGGVTKMSANFWSTSYFSYNLQPTDSPGTWYGKITYSYFDDYSLRWKTVTISNPVSVQPKTGDYDMDGMANGWEVQYGFNPFNAADATADADYDGLTNLWEYQHNTNPLGQAHWAIVICGGGSNWDEDPVQSYFVSEANEAVNVLVETGRYNTGNLQYLNPDVSQPNVDDATNSANVNAAFNTWLASRCDADDIVTIYFIDHGDSSTGHNFVVPDASISATTVATWIGYRAFYRLTFVIEACFAGNVWTDAIGGAGRITVASSTAAEVSQGVNGWPIFGHSYWGANMVIGGISVEGAFNAASAYTVATTTNNPPLVPQHPVMNDQIVGDFTNW